MTFCHGVGPVTAAEIVWFTQQRADRIRTDLLSLERRGYLRQTRTHRAAWGSGWVSTGAWDPDADAPVPVTS